MSEKKRAGNIELLRMLMGMAVVILHYNFNPAGGGAIENAGGVNYYVLMFLESVSIVAVNVFMIISGYFSSGRTTVNLAKPIRLLAQLMIFNGMIYAIKTLLLAQAGFSLVGLVMAMAPANYYVILYLVVLVLSPYLNVMTEKLTDENFRAFILLLGGVFLIYPTIVDVMEEVLGRQIMGLSSISLSGSGAGYTIVNFVLCYLIGAYLKRFDLKKVSQKKVFAGYMASLLVVYAWSFVLPSTSRMYSNPVVMLEAVLLFVLFAKVSLSDKVIGKLAPASFSCYLIHESILAEMDFRFVVQAGIGYLLCHILLTVILIYLFSYLIQLIWDLLSRRFFAWLSKREFCIRVREE